MNLKPHISPGRLKQIVKILAKYGFEDVLGYLNLPGRDATHRITRVPPGHTPYERIRMALEELGPTFVKFGQILSVRADLIPRPLVLELERLQDDAAPIDAAAALSVVRENLPRPVDDVLAHFDPRPLAAASLSQVHRGVLRADGREVALKIQRPGIREDIDRDLELFAFIARRLHARIESLACYDLPGLVELLRRTLETELDFLREARHMHIAGRQMSALPGIRVPVVERGLSSTKVLVVEYIEGVRPDGAPPAEGPRLARIGLAATVTQILENGFFHADPHPGNMLIVGGETICLLDWGMVGRLTPNDRDRMIDLLGAIVHRDSDALVDVLLSIAGRPSDIERRSLQVDIMELLDMHTVTAVADIRLGVLLLDISDLIRKHRLHLPADLFLMFKALVTAEGTVRSIDPRLDVISEVAPHVRRLALERLSPPRVWGRIRSLGLRLAASPGRFPKQVARVVDQMRRGELRLRFEHHNLGDLRHTLDKIFSRLTLGIISGSMIIGSSLILVTELPPMVAGYSMLGLIGYLLAGVLGLWVVYDILRSR
jgi:ubiquinone biosynthesis protein